MLKVKSCLACRFDDARQERVQKYQGMNLYIKNLVDQVDDAELRREFEQFGTITSAKVMRNPQGKSKGFGFVCYSTSEEATRAVTEMGGRMLHDKPLYVALAQQSDQRKAHLQQRYQQPGGFLGPMGPPMGGMGPPMPGMNGAMPMYPPGGLPPYVQGSIAESTHATDVMGSIRHKHKHVNSGQTHIRFGSPQTYVNVLPVILIGYRMR